MEEIVESAAAPKARTPTSVMLATGLAIAVSIVFLWYAPASYFIYLALHITSIVIWVGGDLTLTTLGVVFERKGDSDALAQLGKMGGWIGPHVYTPALFAALGFGIALVEKGHWGWNHFWIDFALAGWAVTASAGVTFIGPELGRIGRAAEELGPTSPEVGRRVKRLFTIFRFQTALLVVIVIDMGAKPTF
jgi:uncharacterized membrane protein